MDYAIENTLIKFDHDIKGGQTADMLKSRTRSQNLLNKQVKWAEECKALLNMDNSGQD